MCVLLYVGSSSITSGWHRGTDVKTYVRSIVKSTQLEGPSQKKRLLKDESLVCCLWCVSIQII